MNKDKIVRCTAYGLIGFHVFVCCGPVLLAAIIGVAAPFSNFIPHYVMDILLAIGGLALVVSWIHHLRGCGCRKTLLVISTILFLAALVMHFVMPLFTGAPSCH